MVISSRDLNIIKTYTIGGTKCFSKLEKLYGVDEIIKECKNILDNNFINLSSTQVAFIYKIIASGYLLKFDYEKAIKSAKKSLDMLVFYEYTGICVELYIIIAKAYGLSFDLGNALYYYEKAIKLNKIVNDSIFDEEIITNIGFMFFYSADYKSALKYFKIASKITKNNFDAKSFVTSVSYFDFYVIFCYIELSMFDEAKILYSYIKKILENVDDKKGYKELLYCIESRILEINKSYYKADLRFKALYKNIERISDDFIFVYVLINRCFELFNRNDYRCVEDIKKYLVKAEKKAKRTFNLFKLDVIYKLLVGIYLEYNLKSDDYEIDNHVINNICKKHSENASKLIDLNKKNRTFMILKSYNHKISKRRGDFYKNEKESGIRQQLFDVEKKNKNFELTQSLSSLLNIMSYISTFNFKENFVRRIKLEFNMVMLISQIVIFYYDRKNKKYIKYKLGYGNDVIVQESDDLDILNNALYKVSKIKDNYVICSNRLEVQDLMGDELYISAEDKIVNSMICVYENIDNGSDMLLSLFSLNEFAYKIEHALMFKILTKHLNKIKLNELIEEKISSKKALKNERNTYFDRLNTIYMDNANANIDGITGFYNHSKFEVYLRRLFDSKFIENNDYISLTYVDVSIINMKEQSIYSKKLYTTVSEIMRESINIDEVVLGRLSDELFGIVIKGNDDKMFDIIKTLSKKLFPLCNEFININISYMSTQNNNMSNYFKFRDTNLSYVLNKSKSESFSLSRNKIN